MYYVPKKLPRNACVTALILFGAAASLFFISEFFAPRLAFQLLALIAVSVAIFLVSRYVLTDYKYVITDIDAPGDEIKFTIVKINGKREAIMATFELKDAYALEKCRTTKEFERIHGKVTKLYSYVSNFMSGDVYKLAINFNNMKVLFSIEISEQFATEIKARIPENTDKNDK